MTTHYRFRVFRWLDFLTFGLSAIVSIVLTAWGALTPGNSIIGLVILIATVLGFLFIYAMVLYRRARFARDIAYVTVHGLIVMQSEWTPQRLLVEKETERAVKLWETAVLIEAMGGKPVERPWALKLVRGALEGIVLRWAKAPFTMHLRPAFKWMGLTSRVNGSMMVGLVEPLEHSALGHEIGHVILLHWRDDGSEEMLKAFHDKYGVPC